MVSRNGAARSDLMLFVFGCDPVNLCKGRDGPHNCDGPSAAGIDIARNVGKSENVIVSQTKPPVGMR